MSYDIYLTIDTGGEHEATVCEVGNHTSNTRPMWDKALSGDFQDLDGKNAGESIEALTFAVVHMENNSAEYLPLNPPNGWGNYNSALKYLYKLLRACEENPKATIRMSY